MLVWLDRPVGLRLWRVVRRAVLGLGKTRPDMADGCPERLSSLPQFIHYIWSTRRSERAKIVRLVSAASRECQVVHLRTDENITHFVADFPSVR
jgi:hypothetical protein